MISDPRLKSWASSRTVRGCRLTPVLPLISSGGDELEVFTSADVHRLYVLSKIDSYTGNEESRHPLQPIHSVTPFPRSSLARCRRPILVIARTDRQRTTAAWSVDSLKRADRPLAGKANPYPYLPSTPVRDTWSSLPKCWSRWSSWPSSAGSSSPRSAPAGSSSSPGSTS